MLDKYKLLNISSSENKDIVFIIIIIIIIIQIQMPFLIQVIQIHNENSTR